MIEAISSDGAQAIDVIRVIGAAAVFCFLLEALYSKNTSADKSFNLGALLLATAIANTAMATEGANKGVQFDNLLMSAMLGWIIASAVYGGRLIFKAYSEGNNEKIS